MPVRRSNPAWLREFDHTADIGFVVRAASPAVLFARAATALFRVIASPAAVRATDRATIRVTAPDRAALLVRWLSELNVRHLTQRRLFRRFRVTRCTATALAAEVAGERIDPSRHAIYTEVKAITYHRLRVARRGRTWTARVIVDV